jgi:predicted ribosome quality control (RQC) complex YloA/Tae2 family protein
MSFDALTLSAVRDELAPLLTGARIQRVVFGDELSLALEVFAPSVGRTNVLMSAHPQRSRVQRIRQLPARGIEHDSPFGLLVRKHLRHARIRSVQQPRLERVFELDCEQRDPSERPYRAVLIVEAMGRRSNLILVDGDGVILDAARRSPPSRNARRPVLPHLPYASPPAQDRLFPEQISPESLSADASGPLDRWLAQRVAGLSPTAAREIAFRVCGEIQPETAIVDWTHVAPGVQAFLATEAWSPTVAFDAEGHALEFAPFALSHLELQGARLERFESIGDAMEAYYARAQTEARRGDPLAAERKALLAPIDRAAHATARRVAALEHQLTSGQNDREPLRRAGDLILAHLAEIPAMATELDVDGERIELDPRLTPSENAQDYFGRYRKAREAEARVPRLLEEARNTAEHLGNLRTLVEVADQMDAVRALRREVSAATSARAVDDSKKADSKKAPKSRSTTPYRRVALADGWEALVGTSAAGNATVTFDVAGGDDLWLHARGMAGAHVILRGGSDPPAHVLERAARLAAAHSAARDAQAVEVDVTLRRYVKKIAGGPPGLVRYANERTLRVTPHA